MTRTPEIDADRLWEAHRLMAEIGPIPGGGSRRLALSPEDAAARALLLDWTRPLGLAYAQDAIGNMFF
ncbi:MAG: Zn-dependent hydrolase, partial [Rhodospirillales bacterium]|nr:Zn-dependent hydrolase [Rhodospirillales bacterium]